MHTNSLINKEVYFQGSRWEITKIGLLDTLCYYQLEEFRNSNEEANMGHFIIFWYNTAHKYNLIHNRLLKCTHIRTIFQQQH